MRVSLLALWESGWLPRKVEAFMWRQLASAYRVDELALCPLAIAPRENLRQFATVGEALPNLQGEPIFLDPNKGEPLASFTHPDEAVYVFGRAGDDNRRWSQGRRFVRIVTPAQVDFFALQAAAIVLYDRETKRKWPPTTAPR